jgi:ketosteroid isomerase-like protein
MTFSKRYYSLIIPVATLLLFSCSWRNKKKEIESAMKTYDHLIQKMDPDSIAMIYTADGDLGEIAHGRDSIRKFLSGFKNVKVLSVSSSSDKIEIKEDTAVQSGRFNQIALVNHTDTMKPAGTYVAKWIWIKDEGWKIKTMTTKPDQ